MRRGRVSLNPDFPIEINLHHLQRWGLVGFALVLLAGLAVSSRQRIYDERFHLERVDQIVAGRPWLQVFSEPTVSAVGPVFPIFQAAVVLLSPDVRAARLLVLAMSAAVVGLTAFLLVSTGMKAGSAVLLLGASPFVVSAMLALTEMLALLFVLGAFALIWTQGNRWMRVVLSGVLLALATLSRQTSLLFALPLAAAWFMMARIRLVELAVLATAPTAALLTLLALWGGVIPPGQEHMAGGFTLLHFVQALIYAAVIGCVMNPGFLLGWRPVVAIGVSLTANLLLGLVHEPVLLTVFPKGTLAAEVFSRLFFGTGMGLAVAYFGRAGFVAWTARQWPSLIWLGCVFAVSVGCGAISAEFSSRYIVAAIPFVLLIAATRPSPMRGKLALALAVVGFGLSLNALRGYGLWTG